MKHIASFIAVPSSREQILSFNPSPAEPGYILLCKTVEYQNQLASEEAN